MVLKVPHGDMSHRTSVNGAGFNKLPNELNSLTSIDWPLSVPFELVSSFRQIEILDWNITHLDNLSNLNLNSECY